jgi:hypothetical protein
VIHVLIWFVVAWAAWSMGLAPILRGKACNWAGFYLGWGLPMLILAPIAGPEGVHYRPIMWAALFTGTGPLALALTGRGKWVPGFLVGLCLGVALWTM